MLGIVFLVFLKQIPKKQDQQKQPGLDTTHITVEGMMFFSGILFFAWSLGEVSLKKHVFFGSQ